MMAIVIPVYKYLNKKISGLLNLNKIAKQRRFIFSAKDVIAGNVIALDEGKKKLVYLKNSQNNSSCIIIDLNSVEHCSVQKQYLNINAGDLPVKKMSDFLKSIFLKLRLKNQKTILTISFYESEKNTHQDIPQAERQAKSWQLQIAKLLPVPTVERA